MTEELDFMEMPSVDDVQPLEAVPANEYELLIVSVKFALDKNECPYMQPMFRIINELNAKLINKYIPMPFLDPAKDPDEAKEDFENARRQLKYFTDWAGIPAIGGKLTKEDIVGKRGRAILKCKGSEEDEYGIQNEIAKFLS